MKRKLLLFTLILSTISYGQDFDKGKELFNQNCAACHNMERKMTGPALKNIVNDQGRDWTKQWVYNSGALIESGDVHANEVWKEYNQMAMPAYNWLEDSDLESIITYLEKYNEVEAEKMAALKPAVEDGAVQQVAVTNSPLPTYLWVLIIICGLVLILSIYAFYIALNQISQFVTKTGTTNNLLLKKLNLSSKEIESELEETISKEVEKEVKKKIKNLKNDINNQLNNFN